MSSEKLPSPEQILKLRKNAGLNQTAFGKIAAISFRAVSLIETGRQNPSKGTVVLWARHFDDDFGIPWIREHLNREKSKPQPPIDLRQLVPGIFGDNVNLRDLSDEDILNFLQVIRDAYRALEKAVEAEIKRRKRRPNK